MRLRSLTRHVKDQNWFAVFLDFFIVVVGILIAFQITNWNSSRADQNRTHEYLVRLQSDFGDLQARLEHSVDQYDESLQAIVRTRSMLNSHDELSEDEEERFLHFLDQIDAQSIPGWRSATYLEMQSAGVLDLIKNSELKQSLVEYDQITEIAQKGFEVLMIQTAYVQPILTSLIEYEVNVETSSGTDTINGKTFEFERMKREPEFKSALSALARSQSNNRVLQANQLIETNKVLKALSEVLE